MSVAGLIGGDGPMSVVIVSPLNHPLTMKQVALLMDANTDRWLISWVDAWYYAQAVGP